MKFELENIKDNKKVKNIMLDVETSKIEPEKAVNMIFKLFKESL